MKIKDFNTITEKSGAVMRENIAHIIFAVIVLFISVISFSEISGSGGKLDWSGLSVNLLLQLSVFIPYRWRQKKLSGRNEPFITNKKLYGEKVEEMRAGNHLTEFSEFCRVKAEEARRAEQLAIVHSCGIDTTVYDAVRDGTVDSKVLAKLNKNQLRAIEKAEQKKLKPINPISITANCSNSVKGYGIEFDDNAEDIKSVSGKVISMLVWAVILSYIVISAVITGGIAAVVMLIFRIFMCLMSMCSGIMSGDGFVISKDKVILARIDFLNLFFEWSKSKGSNYEIDLHSGCKKNDIINKEVKDFEKT